MYKSNIGGGGGGEEGYNLKFLKKLHQNICSLTNYAKFIIIKNSR